MATPSKRKGALPVRVIPVLLLDRGYVVQTRQFQILNRIHSDPVIAAQAFNAWDADEVVVLDITRDGCESARELFYTQFRRIADEFDVPLSVGGWVRTMQDVERLLKLGADKIVVNSAFKHDPEFVRELSVHYGRQILIASIDADLAARVFDRSGHTGFTLQRAADMAEALGAGELLLQSIAHDGTGAGYALDLFKPIIDSAAMPTVLLGGVGEWEHLVAGAQAGASGVAFANKAHYIEHSVLQAKDYLTGRGVYVRPNIARRR